MLGFANEIPSGYKDKTVIGIKTKLERVGNIPSSVKDEDQLKSNNLPGFITGGDISPDGTKIFLRNEDRMF